METGLFSFDIIRDVLLENYHNVMKSYGDEAIDDAMKTIKDSFDKGGLCSRIGMRLYCRE